MEKKKVLKPIAVNPKAKKQIEKAAKDVAKFADKTKEKAIEAGQAAIEAAEKGKQDLDLRILQPIFQADLEATEFPKLIRIVERSNKYNEGTVCEGSIGRTSQHKGVELVSVFEDSIAAFGLSFYPDLESEFYYVDPCNKTHYIALDDYFTYLKEVRVNELEIIAQALGAKHFKVTYKEEKKSFNKKKANTVGKAKKVIEAEAKHELIEKDYAVCNIAAESYYTGHSPKRPELHYWEKDTKIQSLVASRMDEDNPLTRKTYTFQMSQTSGMKANYAVKIDGVLKALKCNGNATLESEAQNESRRYLEYQIEF